MKKKLTYDISPTVFQYLILIFVFAFALWTLLVVSFDRVLQFQVIVAISIFYFLWSIIHHLYKRDLSLKVVAEYFFFGLLATVVGYVILLR